MLLSLYSAAPVIHIRVFQHDGSDDVDGLLVVVVVTIEIQTKTSRLLPLYRKTNSVFSAGNERRVVIMNRRSCGRRRTH